MDKIKYAFFDLDGTLLNDDHEILDETIDSFKEIRNENIKIGIITGRPQCMIKKEVDIIKPDLPICGINGTLILKKNHDFNEPLLMSSIQKNELLKISYEIFENKITCIFYSIDKMLVFNPYSNSSHIKNIKNRINSYPNEFKWDIKKVTSIEDIEDIQIFKVLVIIENNSIQKIEKLKKIILRLKNIYFVKSQNHLLDIMPCGSSKGLALNFLHKNKYIDLNKTIVFGDQENDISMFLESKISVAMKNAKKNVKLKAKKVTKLTNNENGATRFLLDEIRRINDR